MNVSVTLHVGILHIHFYCVQVNYMYYTYASHEKLKNIGWSCNMNMQCYFNDNTVLLVLKEQLFG